MPGRTDVPFRMTPVVFHVLLALAEADRHAYGILKDLPERTGGAVEIGPGSLHFTLQKLLEADMIEEARGQKDDEQDDSRRKYFRLTAFGREALAHEASRLARIVDLAADYGLLPGRDGA